MNKSIVYLNYSPYENSGHILDYLLENFHHVYLFSLAHHTLGRKDPINKLAIYENGKLKREEVLPYLKIPQQFVSLFIPIRSMINALQIIYKIYSLINEYGKIDIYFTVNAFTASIGRMMRSLGLVEKNIFWVWDYYPYTNGSLMFRIMRWLYWQFDKFATYSDEVFYLHQRIGQVRLDQKMISKKDLKIVPIGTGEPLPIKRKRLSEIKIGFIGVLKESQGVDMLLDAGSVLSKNLKKVSFEIIGSGPDEKLFKKKAKNLKNVKYNFHGLVSEEEFHKILYNCTVGVSPYKPDDTTMSKYTDPGKPKRYLEFNLPVITTDVIEFSNEIVKNKAGVIVEYGDSQDLVEAINKIIKSYDQYVENARKLNKKYFYKTIFPPMFK